MKKSAVSCWLLAVSVAMATGVAVAAARGICYFDDVNTISAKVNGAGGALQDPTINGVSIWNCAGHGTAMGGFKLTGLQGTKI